MTSAHEYFHRTLVLSFALIFFFVFGAYSTSIAADVTLAWDANTEPDLAGYKIHYGTTSRKYSVVIDVGKSTTCTASDLVPGKTYYFAATAYNTSGISSAFSEEVSYSVPNSSPTRPSAPSGPSTGLINTNHSFATTATDPEGEKLQYRFVWGTGEVSKWGAAEKSCAWSEPGYYCVRAQARDTGGALSAWSDCNMVMISNSLSDRDGDGIPDDLEVDYFGTHPGLADTDGDGFPDGQEAARWGPKWNGDIDSDGVINLLDWDADGDGFSDGEEVAKGTDPTDKNSKVAALPMEAGMVSVDHNWKKVTFRRQFLVPVVVAGGRSANDPEAAVVRIRNVTGSGFEIRLQEWECYDGAHAEESVGYLAVERGVYTIANSFKVEAGRFLYKRSGRFAVKSFQQEYAQPPVVAATVTTYRDPLAVEVRLKNITPEGFHIRLQEQEANEQDHGDELISYVAWQSSSGTFNGVVFEVDRTEMEVNHDFSDLTFTQDYSAAPILLAQMQSFNGADTAGLQWRDRNAAGVAVRITEETSADSETSHVNEVVGCLVFSGSP